MHPDQPSAAADARVVPDGRSATATPAVSPSGFLFIDNARFLCILAIVLRHTELFDFEDATLSSLETWVIQLRSFGVLIFFVSSGFLLSAWLDRPGATRRAYWRTRLTQVLAPWVFWAGLFMAMHAVKLAARGHFSWSILPSLLRHDIFFESYWFVPVLLFSLAILLPLRPLWKYEAFGVALFAINTVYALNQYFRWFNHWHTVAFFGYLFHLWLGIQLHRHFDATRRWIDGISWPAMASLAGGGLLLAILEGRRLIELGHHDAYSVLNPANQVYAILVLGVLLKLKIRIVPRFIDVRKESYGIYLAHQATASIGRGLINLAVGIPAQGLTFFDRVPEMISLPAARVGVWLLWCLIIYSVSLLLAKTLRRTRFCWLVGIRQPGRREAVPSVSY